ncbi:hypothetical protein AVEN_104875-1 [Araneus ventricosus]|uniref:Transposase Tc1-like domain-containing protein n=1 Tax=Araneus ventricosus TaxID=182803 RepID=A0A4Y2QHK0_ARAVE|nr:hypothetical protein AVEN_104875-1 [Araneus ventricosus]
MAYHLTNTSGPEPIVCNKMVECETFCNSWTVDCISKSNQLFEGTAVEDLELILFATRHRAATPTHLRSLVEASGRLISRSTVRRRLHGGGLHARRPVV